MKEGSVRIEIIGHVGWETHVLVDRLISIHPIRSKSVASNIIDTKSAVGGSAFFANIVAQRMGVVPSLITSLGVDNDEHYAIIINQLQYYSNGSYCIIRRGRTNWFLSLWEYISGNKVLYCQLNSNINVNDIMMHHSTDVHAVIIYGILNPPNAMKKIIDLYKAQNTFITIVPNQSFLNNRNLLIKLLPETDILFFNTAEVLEFTNTKTVDEAITVLLNLVDHFSPITICLTQGRCGLVLIKRDGEVVKFPIHEKVRFALGGGDILAASMTALLAQAKEPDVALTEAINWSILVMRDIEPFKIIS
jgi:sugar/nucleoside kinase (ribokinase family)